MAKIVTEQFYFHINSNANLSPYPLMRRGDILEIGGSTNPFFSFYEKHQRTYSVTDNDTGVVHQVPAMKFLNLVNERKVTSNALPVIARDTARHFLMLARELVWENVRLSEFPQAPSRQRCIWLVESMDDALKWAGHLRLAPGNYSVVRVRATGCALTVDSNYLAGDSEPLPVWFEKAWAYWRGNRSESPLTEVLFEGRIEVDDIENPAEHGTA